MAGPTTTIRKAWNPTPIEVGKRWVRKFAGATARNWCRDKRTLQEVLDHLRPTADDPILSVAQYETRAVREGSSGVYSQRHVFRADKEDEDLTRNLTAIATVIL